MNKYLIMYNDDSGCYYEGDRPSLRFKFVIEKEYAKIVNDEGEWHNKFIPRLLHTVFYSVVTEELWDCLKKINNGSVNFQELKHLCIQKTKQVKPELF